MSDTLTIIVAKKNVNIKVILMTETSNVLISCDFCDFK